MAAGGGGAGAVGGNDRTGVGINGQMSGIGGDGLQWFNGNYYAGGGGGGSPTSYSPGAGGIGGGGSGSGTGATQGTPGTTNTGGGAGGASSDAEGSTGGSGIAILRYLGTPVATGGTITQSGGYTYHTFTSSGTFTLN